MNRKTILLIGYGILLLIGGLIGYLKAHSWPSLLMGGLSGGLALLCAYTLQRGVALAETASKLLSGCLMLFFSYRFLLTFKFFPSGLMAIISLLVLSALLFCKEKRCQMPL